MITTQKRPHCKQDLQSMKIDSLSLLSFTQLNIKVIICSWIPITKTMSALFIMHCDHKGLLFLYIGNFNRLSQIVKHLWISIPMWWVLNRLKELYNYSRLWMASVDILFCAGRCLLCDRKMIEYLWLGLHNSVSFTGKESNE